MIVEFLKKERSMWKQILSEIALLAYSVAMGLALIAEGRREFLPTDLSQSTAWNYIRFTGIVGFLWLTLGGGMLLIYEWIRGWRALNRYWLATCCTIDSKWETYFPHFCIALTLFTTAFLYFMSAGLPAPRRLTLALCGPLFMSLNIAGLDMIGLGYEWSKPTSWARMKIHMVLVPASILAVAVSWIRMLLLGG